MNKTKILTAAVIVGAVVWATCETVGAQTWHKAGADDTGAVRQVDWEQRVLHRPAQLQWQSARRPAGSYAPPASAAEQSRPAVRFNTAQRPSYDEVFATASPPDEPVAEAIPTPQPTPAANSRAPIGEPISDAGTTHFEPMAEEGAFADDGACDSCNEPGGACGPSGGPAREPCDYGYELFDGRCGHWLRDLSVFAGADAFKGPLDHGQNGNFGLHEGLNFAGPLGDPWGCGYQVGANFVQSNFSATTDISIDDHPIRAADRRQYFLTGAIFRRAICGGLQGGVAFDYLRDDYYDQSDLKQIRSETGLVLDDVFEIGYYGVYGVGGDRVYDGKLDSTDMFVGYVRRNFENGGDGRIWAGATGTGDALLGADLWIPLGRGFALENRVNYLIPKERRGEVAQSRESWGLTIQLVWFPGQNASCQHKNPFRALFNVADNSLFMVDRLTDNNQ